MSRKYERSYGSFHVSQLVRVDRVCDSCGFTMTGVFSDPNDDEKSFKWTFIQKGVTTNGKNYIISIDLCPGCGGVALDVLMHGAILKELPVTDGELTDVCSHCDTRAGKRHKLTCQALWPRPRIWPPDTRIEPPLTFEQMAELTRRQQAVARARVVRPCVCGHTAAQHNAPRGECAGGPPVYDSARRIAGGGRCDSRCSGFVERHEPT